jgi:iron(II)-dependent oxidoreductase
VTLPVFKIGKYPVTNAKYRQFVEATKRDWDSEEGWQPNCSNSPAVRMTWHDARDYSAWLTEVWRKRRQIKADEAVRLPSEAEWEKAARGTCGLTYPWGDTWDESLCNTSESGIGRACAVGMYPDGAGLYGCLDMAGNVWEWTSSLRGKDYWDPDFKYPYDPADGRENVGAGDEILRVLRGGSWGYNRSRARCSYRLRSLPDLRGYNIGFRVVVSPISSSFAF